MNTLKRIAMGVGGVVIVAMILAVTMPKAAHAIVSTLVTVANTSSNPVPVEQTKQLSANYLTLYNVGSSYTQINPDSSSQTFSMPAGEQFVITDVLWEVGCDNSQSFLPCTKPAGSIVQIMLSTTDSSGFLPTQQPSGYISRAVYGTNIGTELTAGASESFKSGFVVSQLPLPQIYPYAQGGEFIEHFFIKGYLVPTTPAT